MLIGDAINPPTLKASPNFGGSGLGVIDGDKVSGRSRGASR